MLHYPSKRTGWPVASAAGLCQLRTFVSDEVMMAKSVVGFSRLCIESLDAVATFGPHARAVVVVNDTVRVPS